MRVPDLPVLAREILAALPGAFSLIWRVLRAHLRVDRYVAIMAIVYAGITLPLVPSNTDDPQMLAAFANDEPWLTMVFEGMSVPPYGNPANFINSYGGRKLNLPAHWGHLRYDGIFYYGATYLDLGLPALMAVKALGFDTFPAAPMILRTVSALAGLLSLLLLYNFAKRNAGRGAAVLCTAFVLTEPYLIIYALLIHPDTVQLFFALLTFLLAVEHAKSGRVDAMLAMGIAAGIVQGSKVGGPWLAPMILAAVFWGLKSARTGGASIARAYPSRLFQTGAAAALGFFLTDPYALVQKYYAIALYNTWGMVKTGPFGKVNILTWLESFYNYLGSAYSIIALLGLICVALHRKWREDPTRPLAAILAASQIAWFSLMGGLWVMLSYLLVAYCLLAFLGADLICSVLRSASDRLGRRYRGAYQAVIAALLLLIVEPRWAAATIDAALFRHLNKTSTVVALNRWALAGGLPRDARIIHDDLAYFRPQDFANAKMHGGILTWPQVRTFKPDYVLLSSSLYGSAWIEELRRTQRLDSYDESPHSMRLYQDLLDTERPGPTKIPGVTLVYEEKARGTEVEACKSRFALPQGTQGPTWMVERVRRNLSDVARVCAIVTLAAQKDAAPATGSTIKVYRIDSHAEILRIVERPPGLQPSRTDVGERAFASSTAPGYSPAYAFDKSDTTWSADTGSAPVGSFIGYDFGPGKAKEVDRVSIKWVYESATPSAVTVEYSDNGAAWKSAGEFAVNYPTGPFRWWQKDHSRWWSSDHRLKPAGAHRFWRVLASGVEPEHSFAVAEIRFLDRSEKQ